MSSAGLSGFVSLRSVLRRALSRCFCWRACSFWRLLNVDRPLGILVPHLQMFGHINFMWKMELARNLTIGAREVGAHGRDSRRVHDRRRRPHQTAALGLWAVPS